MKFDKETIIVVMVCIVLITLCNVFLSPKQTEQPQQTVNEQVAAETQNTEKPAEAAPVNADKPADAKPAEAAPANADKPAEKPAVADQKADQKTIPAPVDDKETLLENDQLTFCFNGNGILTKVVSKNIKKTKSDSPITFDEVAGNEPFSCDLEGWKFKSAQVVKDSDTQVTVLQTYTNDADSVVVKKVFI